MSSNIFITDNFLLASYLLSQSTRLVSIDKANPKRLQFKFEVSLLAKKNIDLFFSHSALVEPHKLYYSQRDLKQLIYQHSEAIPEKGIPIK